ncbi:MAG: hypothetical protein EOM20_03325 [Spartobacteria bacterium]|nr:hypothetical protein [Spartobacteria bacterium]
MKYILIIITALAAVATASAYQVEVGTNSMVVMPSRTVYASQLDDWAATNAYVNGDYAAISNRACMCLYAGTSSTNEPDSSAEIFADGTVTWVRVAAPRNRRFGIVKKGSGSTAVYLDFASATTTNSGFVLSYNGAGIIVDSADSYDGPVSAVSVSGNNTLIVGDR